MRCPTMVTILMLCVPLTAEAQQTGRIKVARADELPRHLYPISGTATALFQNDAQFAALAQQIERDLRGDLAAYDIQNHATLKRYYGILSNLALERADYKTAVAYQDSIRAVEDKPGLRLSAGILERALSTAARAPGEPLDTARFRQAFRGEIAALPYPDGRAALAAMKGRFEVLVPDPLGAVQRRIGASAGSGSLFLEQAQWLIAMRVVRDRIAAVRDVMLAELDGIMAAQTTTTADIWAARDVLLDGRTDLAPVTIAIWDSGVDVAIFPGQLFTNPGEIADNGKDDDGNGYVDDVHGIAYDLERGRVTGMLQPVSLTPAELIEFRGAQKGMMDAEAGLNTPEADAVRRDADRRRSAAISDGDGRSTTRKFREYQLYAHGTHVAGIAFRGNPAARILVARRSRGMGHDQLQYPPQPPTMDRARAFAQEFRETIEYFRQRGVRVVNMSWSIDAGLYESRLAANNIGTPEERPRLARQIFDVVASGLHDAMAAAPDMLFVVAAGNDNADIRFIENIPASFDLPNLIIVGAVDAAGDETSFTSYGKVDVHANGYHVLSKVPGGATIPMSGTSMATPQVVNLAAKLLAVKPSLTVAELRRAIVESAEEKTIGPGKKIRLLNPKAAVARIASPGSATRGTAVERALAIESVAVIAMDGAPDASRVRRGMTVVVEGGRVRAVGPSGKVEVPRGATHIDGTGRYLIPGLRDMHVHLQVEGALRLMLIAGVTGARVMAGRPDILSFRDRIARGELLGPELYVAGPILEGQPPAGFENEIPIGGKVIVHDSLDGARLVREQKAAGYDFIKVYNNVPADAYRAIVAEAKRLGMPVTGHVPFAVGLDGALAAGQVSIEHLRGYEFLLVPRNAPQQPGPDLRSRTLAWAYADPARIRALAERTRDAGVWNVPTLATRMMFEPDSDVVAYLRSVNVPDQAIRRLRASRRPVGFLSNFTAADFVAARAGFAAQDSLVRALAGVGAGLMAGTDAAPPGFALHRELEMLVHAGLTPYQALEAATRNPARFLGRNDGSGTVAAGSPADLVLLDADPLADISNIRRIRGVVRRGTWLDRQALDSLFSAEVRRVTGEPRRQ